MNHFGFYQLRKKMLIGWLQYSKQEYDALMQKKNAWD